MAELKRLYQEMGVINARRDLLQYQLERLDSSNPRTVARQSMANEVASRLGQVEAEFFAAFTRLREILAR